MGTQGMYKGKHAPMGIGCMYTESMYGDRMYVHRINVWRQDACIQMANPMETRCISKNAILYGNTVCVQRTNPTGMYKQRTNAQCMYCINEQSKRECDAREGPILWGHDVCTNDQYMGSCACTKNQSYVDTMQVHRTNPMWTCANTKGPILWGTLHVVTHTYVQSQVRALCHVQLHGNSTCTEKCQKK